MIILSICGKSHVLDSESELLDGKPVSYWKNKTNAIVQEIPTFTKGEKVTFDRKECTFIGFSTKYTGFAIVEFDYRESRDPLLYAPIIKLKKRS